MSLSSDFKELLEELGRGGVELVESLSAMGEHEVVFMGQPPRRVDFLRTIDGVASAEIFASAVEGQIDGVRLKVISLEHLITNKRASGRPQDLIDAAFLEKMR